MGVINHRQSGVRRLPSFDYKDKCLLYIFFKSRNLDRGKGLKMVNVNLKEQLQKFVKANGIKYKYIAKETNVSESMLSHWRAGRKELSKDKLKQLQQIIN